MPLLVLAGTGVAVAGMVLLLWCIWLVLRARRQAADQAEFRARMQRVIALNFGALALSALGLMMIVLGMAL